jgi:drug/metabolite transporter (DMT)-like permease
VSKTAAKTLALTALVICAFAGNSLLTRLALAPAEISASHFVGIRLISGAVVLALLGVRHQSEILPRGADIPGIASLLVYAMAFTFAYVSLGVATGALILFPTVQLTLALIATFRGTPPTARARTGLLIAFAGLVVMLAPRSTAPPPAAALMMALAGIAWGAYTYLGRGAANPFARTARNFIGAAPFALFVMLAFAAPTPSMKGVILAIASGAITSALGYVVWYAVLPRLNMATAGATQLLVPVITAAGGVFWLGETPSIALVSAACLVLSGIWLTLGPPKQLRPAA